jgi:hypothetical protein
VFRVKPAIDMMSSLFLVLNGCLQAIVCSAFSVTQSNHHSYISRTIHRRGHGSPTCKSNAITVGTLHSSAISTNEDLLPGIALIDEANDMIAEQMQNLRQTPYFRLFCVDILASCEYMPQELFECYSETCEVYPVDDDAVSRVSRWEILLLLDFFLYTLKLDLPNSQA